METDFVGIERLMAQNKRQYGVGDILEFDLHGCSVEAAKKLVLAELAKAPAGGRYRFITGRGNHINKNGSRGVLYQDFQNWINDSPFSDKVAKLTQHDGYYEIVFANLQESQIIEPSTIFHQIIEKMVAEDIPSIEKKAHDGDIDSLKLLAHAYQNGLYALTINYKQAFKYYKQAADKGDAWAQLMTGHCYYHGRGVKLNDPLAWKYYDLAIAQDLDYAHLHAGILYLNGMAGKVADHQKACEHFTRAAILGNTIAFRKLGTCYKSGFYFKQSDQKAFNNFKKAADKGDEFSQYNVATMLIQGKGVKRNEEQAFKYYKLSANNGDKDGMFGQANCYYEGRGVTKNVAHALSLFEKAAQAGQPSAAFRLFWHYEKTDEDKSNHFLIQAANAGHFYAQVRVFFRSESKQGKYYNKQLAEQMMVALRSSPSELFYNLGSILCLPIVVRIFLDDNATKRQQKKGKQILQRYALNKNNIDAAKLLHEVYIGDKESNNACFALVESMASGDEESFQMYFRALLIAFSDDEKKSWIEALYQKANKGQIVYQWLLISLVKSKLMKIEKKIDIQHFENQLMKQEFSTISQQANFVQLYVSSLLVYDHDDKQREKGLQLLYTLAEKYGDANYFLAILSREIQRDDSITYQLFQKGVALDSALCKMALGQMLLGGDGIPQDPQDPQQGIIYLKQAAEQENPDAMLILHRLYFHGIYVEMDIRVAADYLEKAKKAKLDAFGKNFHAGHFQLERSKNEFQRESCRITHAGKNAFFGNTSHTPAVVDNEITSGEMPQQEESIEPVQPGWFSCNIS